jgi:TrpR-related protein YerC/YecD
MMSSEILKEKNELFSAILSLSSLEECDAFFKDLCTEKEIASMVGRIMAAKLLKKGETYEQIISKTDISSATLSRVSKALKSGEGYKKIL